MKKINNIKIDVKNGNVATELSEGVATARVAFVGSDVTDAPKGTLVLALYKGEYILRFDNGESYKYKEIKVR